MMDRLESRWLQGDILKSYDSFRTQFREASSKVVNGVFRKYVSENDSILEIGSGLGELVKLAPEYGDQIQQTEQSLPIVREHLNLNPNSNIKTANVYELPFSDNSFDVCVGYSVFDTLADLEKALIEVGRVLGDDGRFIHFLDCTASAHPFFYKYVPQGLIPFPLYEVDEELQLWHGNGVQLVKQENLPIARLGVRPELREALFDGYVSIPEEMFCLGKSNPDFEVLLKDLSKAIMSSGVESQLVRFNDDFRIDLEANLEKSGYKILNSSDITEEVIIDREMKHRYGFNVFHSDVGLDRSYLDHSLPSNKVKVVSTEQVIVAEKSKL